MIVDKTVVNKRAAKQILASSAGIALVLCVFGIGVWLSQYVPLPGTLIGLLILLGMFVCLGRVPEWVAMPWQFMLQHMSLFFVPAFVSVPLYQAQVMADFWPLFITIFVATALCMWGIGSLTQRWFRRVTKDLPEHKS